MSDVSWRDGQCRAHVKTISVGDLYCHDDEHEGDTHRMELLEDYRDGGDDGIHERMRAARMIDVRWAISDRTVGQLLDEIKTKESET